MATISPITPEANPISKVKGRVWPLFSGKFGIFFGWLTVTLSLAICPAEELATNPELISKAASRKTRSVYLDLRATFEKSPTDPVVAWQFARACFDWAEFSSTREERAAIAEEGIRAGRRAVAAGPELAPTHYYLAMNLGQMARTKLLGALPLVRDMEGLFREAKRLDKTFDYAGADRCLGLLYRDAPGWPVSVGNRKKARKHLEAALRLAPDYVENELNLLEAYIGWNDRKAAMDRQESLALLLPQAREEFTGQRWAMSWLDWDRRWETAQAAIAGWK